MRPAAFVGCGNELLADFSGASLMRPHLCTGDRLRLNRL